MVLSFFGRDITERELTLLLDTHPIAGTLFDNLARIERLGFVVAVGRGAIADLRAVHQRGVPLITAVYTAHPPTHPLPPCGSHCVVVAGTTRSLVAIYDPDPKRSAAPDLIPVARFEAAWRARKYRMASLAPR